MPELSISIFSGDNCGKHVSIIQTNSLQSKPKKSILCKLHFHDNKNSLMLFQLMRSGHKNSDVIIQAFRIMQQHSNSKFQQGKKLDLLVVGGGDWRVWR